MGGIATLDSCGPGRDIQLIPAAHFQFLEACQEFYEIETHIFIHANYFPEVSIDEQPVKMLRWESLRAMTPGPHESGKTVIGGHTSQKNGEILDLGHVKVIDTYCYGGGWLTALDIQTEEVWQADRKGNLRKL
jgi:serine/threonine protein phosphatase 1